MDSEVKYPYLGRFTLSEEEYYVVLFTEPDTGVVVVSTMKDSEVKFGMISNFSESSFEILPPEYSVSLSN